MANFDGRSDENSEEIEGAAPAVSRSALRQRFLVEKVEVNRYLFRQSLQFEHMLLQAVDLQALLETLVVSMPRHFGFRVTELWLFDPENILAELISGRQRYGRQLQLLQDSFVIQELYDPDPDILLIDATDSRMFEILKSEHGVERALLMPLMDSGRMIGSLHLGLEEETAFMGEEEEALAAHLAVMISSCFRLVVTRQQISQLTLLDPLTQISNLRGFEKDITREISRARRADQPLTVVVAEVDEYEDLHSHYGVERSQFVVKKVAERISSDLRATDLMARLSSSRLAVLVPGAGEMRGEEIAERMRQDIDDFSIDDGRGAVMQVTLSIGIVAWEPQQYPAVDMPQLGRQMESVAFKALGTAQSKGGNQVVVSRLSTLIV